MLRPRHLENVTLLRLRTSACQVDQTVLTAANVSCDVAVSSDWKFTKKDLFVHNPAGVAVGGERHEAIPSKPPAQFVVGGGGGCWLSTRPAPPRVIWAGRRAGEWIWGWSGPAVRGLPCMLGKISVREMKPRLHTVPTRSPPPRPKHGFSIPLLVLKNPMITPI